MSGRDDVSNEYLLHSLAQGEVSPEVAAATSLTVEVRQLRAERTTPAPSSGAGPDLGALHETICDNFTGMAEVRQAADLLVAEVRRLTSHADGLSANLGGDLIAWAARAEAAEAEVVTLRARLAAVEARVVEWESDRDVCLAWIADPAMHADEGHPDRLSRVADSLDRHARAMRAALATTGEGQ